jgi:quinol-cytochrome oxidoreductase complex cytochrome b subunit
MKHLLFVLFGIFLVTLLIFSVDAQGSPPTTEPLPTRPRTTPPWSVFPTNMYCYDIISPSGGQLGVR